MHRKTCFGGKYIPRVSFCFKGQPPPILPQNRFWGRTSSISQWRAFSHISWQAVKSLAPCILGHQRGYRNVRTWIILHATCACESWVVSFTSEINNHSLWPAWGDVQLPMKSDMTTIRRKQKSECIETMLTDARLQKLLEKLHRVPRSAVTLTLVVFEADWIWLEERDCG